MEKTYTSTVEFYKTFALTPGGVQRSVDNDQVQTFAIEKLNTLERSGLIVKSMDVQVVNYSEEIPKTVEYIFKYRCLIPKKRTPSAIKTFPTGTLADVEELVNKVKQMKHEKKS